jgi:hypothetical protein
MDFTRHLCSKKQFVQLFSQQLKSTLKPCRFWGVNPNARPAIGGILSINQGSFELPLCVGGHTQNPSRIISTPAFA